MKTCASCNEFQSDQAKFCRRCGATLAEPTAHGSAFMISEQGAWCKKCCISYPSSATFCRKCGSPTEMMDPSVDKLAAEVQAQIEILRIAKEKNPGDVNGSISLARLLLKHSAMSAAATELRASLREHPDSDQLREELITILKRMNDWNGVIAQQLVLVESAPEDFARRIALIKSEIQGNQGKNAIKGLEALAAACSADLAKLTTIRDLQLRVGDIDGCIITCRKIVALNPKDSSWFTLVRCLLEVDRHSEAMKAIQGASEAIAKEPRAILYKTLAVRGQDLPAAIQRIDEVDWSRCALPEVERAIVNALRGQMSGLEGFIKKGSLSNSDFCLLSLAFSLLGDRSCQANDAEQALEFYRASCSAKTLTDSVDREMPAHVMLVGKFDAGRSLDGGRQKDAVQHPRKLPDKQRATLQTSLTFLRSDTTQRKNPAARKLAAEILARFGEDALARRDLRAARSHYSEAKELLGPNDCSVFPVLRAIRKKNRKRVMLLVASILLVILSIGFILSVARENRVEDLLAQGRRNLSSRSYGEAMNSFDAAIKLTGEKRGRELVREKILPLLNSISEGGAGLVTRSDLLQHFGKLHEPTGR